MERVIKKYNILVTKEFNRAEKDDFISLTDLLIIKEEIIRAERLHVLK